MSCGMNTNCDFPLPTYLAGPVAQSVELQDHWTLCGAHVPDRKVRGSRCDGRLIFMSLLTGMVAVGRRS